MTLTDSCPNCCRRDIEPARVHDCEHQIVAGYQCPGCGEQWVTQRMKDAYGDSVAAVGEVAA